MPLVLDLYNYIFFCCNAVFPIFECAGNHAYVISGCGCMEVLCGGVCILKHAIPCQASSGGPGQNNQFFRVQMFPAKREEEQASKRAEQRERENTQREI